MTTTQATTEKSYLKRPKAIGITVRKPQFNPKAIRRHFFANSPVMSHLLTALSSTFPIGEQFFVHSVRNVREKVTDEKLQAEIAAFIGQEAMHSKAHAEFNDAWRRDDYNLDSFQAWLGRRDAFIKNAHPKLQLAVTCAFEHFTALLGGYILRHPEVLSTLDDDAIKLWVWHAIEEIEHRAVAFDVYQAVYKDDKVRRNVMKSVTTGFASLTFYSASRLFMQDWRKSVPKVTQNAFGVYMIGKMLISLIPEYLSYFKADFHPSEIDYTDLVNHWKARLADEYDMDGFKPELKAVLYS
ncbi:metal-dependent hydrolase [Acinetobacter chinensis]|jgi:predicted metal-dependent hydrolase|uniref:Metal-dependent hydrolase n=1 Tax=Acinetobacter chinensis TaxID=2004650 RepID=A0ABU3WFY9_9GAMM|nr:metal-dependent hydrolase [Acinetobacter chinensis]MDV2469315.1 metal-dependent hydrolase [Acinetobacter chinensis]